jgi:mRNA-degrading endonuclease YafQ of YafQ-DinJ toxin-antitoxin module
VAKILYTHSYIRRAQKFIKKHPEILPQYTKALRLLEANPTHPSLRLHKPAGKLERLYSVSIIMTYRISLEFLIEEDTIIPIDVGSHDEVYE